MHGVTVRAYESADAAAVRDLFVRVNRELAPAALRERFEGYIAQSLREEIDRIADYYAERDGGFWVAEAGGAVVGMFGIERADPRSAELRRMYVSPALGRRGLARMLLAHAEAVCRSAGFARLVLSTSELQPAALALYRASGYRLVREEVATGRTNKTVGSGLRRYHFEKALFDPAGDGAATR